MLSPWRHLRVYFIAAVSLATAGLPAESPTLTARQQIEVLRRKVQLEECAANHSVGAARGEVSSHVALRCLAELSDVHATLELFMGYGDGSTQFLVDGMEHALAKEAAALTPPQQRLLITFEIVPGLVQEGLKRFAQYGPTHLVVAANGSLVRCRSRVANPPRHRPLEGFRIGAERLKRCSNEASQSGASGRQDIKLVVVEGLPINYPAVEDPLGVRVPDGLLSGLYGVPETHLLTRAWDIRSPLRSLCAASRGVDLVFLGGYGPASWEWLIIEQKCHPQWVLLDHINTPFSAGWIRERLLTEGGWAEVWSGTFRLPAVTAVGDLWGVRKWTALWRLPQN